MHVRLYGFRLTHGAAVSTDDLFRELESGDLASVEFEYGNHKRVLAVEVASQFIYGVMITETERNSFNTMERDAQNRLIIRVDNTPHNRPIIEVNFFLISRAHKIGLYSSYRGSCSLTQFGSIIANRYNAVMKCTKEREIEEYAEANGEEMPSKQKAELATRYKAGQFSLTPVLREGAFDKVVASMQAVYAFDFVETHVKDSRFRNVKTQVSYSKRSVRFVRKKQDIKAIVSAIMNVVTGDRIKQGSVSGKNAIGFDERVPIDPDVVAFSKYPYNDVAPKSHLTLEKISTIDFFGKIQAAMDNHRVQLFGPSPK